MRLSEAAGAARASLRDLIEGANLVEDLKEEPEGPFRGDFMGSDSEAAELLAGIVSAGIAISDFHIEKDNVEDMFLAIGARQVS